MKPELLEFLSTRGLILSEVERKALDSYHALILEASKTLNLISSGDISRLEELHFADSLAPVNLIPRSSQVADWGSGAGLPGIPLAIARPDLKVTLVESRLKKAAFLAKAKRELGLGNVSVFPQRGEALSECFDLITVRAVGKLKEMVKELVRHLRKGGGILFYKGPGLDEELRQAQYLIDLLDLKVSEEGVLLPRGERRRYLLLRQ